MLTNPRSSHAFPGPLRVAVLCSHRAPGLMHLLNQSPERGSAFEIVCCVTSERTFAEEVRVEQRGFPALTHSIADFYDARGAAIFHDFSTRGEYDAATLAIVQRFLPDLLLLDGYLYLVTPLLLRAFANRVINLHFSDLTLRDAHGGPRYPGLRAVRDAVVDGCGETRATVHLVNEQPDAGQAIVRSWPFPVSPLVEDLRAHSAPDVLKAYVFAHQQWMMRSAAGPLMAAALRLIATGAVDLDGLASVAPVSTAPWLLDRHGFLMAPEVELA